VNRYPVLTVCLAVFWATLGTGRQFDLQPAGSKSTSSIVPYRFVVKDLGTFGGPHGQVNDDSVVLNDAGVVAGAADTAIADPTCFDSPYCFVMHAFRWQAGTLTDLGSLPYGANSYAIAINRQGAVAGISENGLVDSTTGITIFHAALWQNGHIHDLETFGGSFSLPNDLNNLGQVVGGAQNLTPDPFNFGDIVGLPSSTQWRAAFWANGKMIDLGNLEKGHEAFAEFINEQGQIAGDAFTNSVVNAGTGYPTVAPFLWENGRMRNLGTLGGHLGTVIALNNRGQVTGQSNLAGDAALHPFLWDHGVLRDLGSLGGSFSVPHWMSETGIVVGESSLPGDDDYRAWVWKNGVLTNLGSLDDDPCSRALGVNSLGQVVGDSFSDCDEMDRPWFWDGSGPIIDLNDLVPPHAGFHLRKPDFINERGEIAGLVDYPNGDRHPVLLIPCDQVKGAPAGCEPSAQAVLAASADLPGRSSSVASSTHPVAIATSVAASTRFRHRLRYRPQ